MPGFDGTGPLGQGPMTGGGFGNCGAGVAPAADAGNVRPVQFPRGWGWAGGFGCFGRFGRGRGRGPGRGFRGGFGR